ncbi:MAG: cob(I)yrinic acid a,c-diamide adenosyltransferase [Candidatus Lokiarchaeota archaeon]
MPEPIYTKKGDKGKTDLLSGERVKKTRGRVEVYGTIDELSSQLGVAKVFSSDFIARYIKEIQETLFFMNAELATTNHENLIKKITPNDIENLEKIIMQLEEKIPKLQSFIIPGGTKSAALLDLSRTVCRRAERRLLTFKEKVNVNPEILKYLNRLSDFLYILARYANLVEGNGDLMISREGTFWQRPE